MVYVKRFIQSFILLLLLNYRLLNASFVQKNFFSHFQTGFSFGNLYNFDKIASLEINCVHMLLLSALIVFFIYFNIMPAMKRTSKIRLNVLSDGYELTLTAIICFTFEALLYIYLCFVNKVEIGARILVINAFMCIALIWILLFNGMLRIFISSAQLGILPRICLLMFWWVPIINIVLLRKFFIVAGKEYVFTSHKLKLNTDRQQSKVCATRYPLLMIHGIFFRDWKNRNYWGRIPGELIRNGAVIHYGNHQSTAPVEQSAEEIKNCILNIIRETGCEKVNIIAHSKGGLDSRYAVSVLGMDQYVASLTTISTPHKGCNYVKKLIDLIPNKAIMTIGKKYESLYTKLGDENPDFFNGLAALTDSECKRLNELMPDNANVLNQSVCSIMKSRRSAAFPLNIGYMLIKAYEGWNGGNNGNDGLVSVKSMEWGNFLGIINPRGNRGISHGDIIDLTGKNIEGFDVCEFYVDLVSGLKAKGV